MESWSILGFLDSIGNGLLGRSLSLASILLPLLDPLVHGEQAAFFPPLLLSCRQFCLDSAFVFIILGFSCRRILNRLVLCLLFGEDLSSSLSLGFLDSLCGRWVRLLRSSLHSHVLFGALFQHLGVLVQWSLATLVQGGSWQRFLWSLFTWEVWGYGDDFLLLSLLIFELIMESVSLLSQGLADVGWCRRDFGLERVFDFQFLGCFLRLFVCPLPSFWRGSIVFSQLRLSRQPLWTMGSSIEIQPPFACTFRRALSASGSACPMEFGYPRSGRVVAKVFVVSFYLGSLGIRR